MFSKYLNHSMNQEAEDETTESTAESSFPDKKRNRKYQAKTELGRAYKEIRGELLKGPFFKKYAKSSPWNISRSNRNGAKFICSAFESANAETLLNYEKFNTFVMDFAKAALMQERGYASSLKIIKHLLEKLAKALNDLIKLSEDFSERKLPQIKNALCEFLGEYIDFVETDETREVAYGPTVIERKRNAAGKSRVRNQEEQSSEKQLKCENLLQSIEELASHALDRGPETEQIRQSIPAYLHFISVKVTDLGDCTGGDADMNDVKCKSFLESIANIFMNLEQMEMTDSCKDITNQIKDRTSAYESFSGNFTELTFKGILDCFLGQQAVESPNNNNTGTPTQSPVKRRRILSFDDDESDTDKTAESDGQRPDAHTRCNPMFLRDT